MNEESIQPRVGRGVYLAETAYVGGDVTIGDACTIMHHVVIRGDVAAIRIGNRVNVQDGAVIHTETGVPLDIGDDVVIGHRAVVHCRRVGRGALIGIGAIVLDQCDVGEGAIVAAGAVVPPGMVVPPGKMAMGVPAASFVMSQSRNEPTRARSWIATSTWPPATRAAATRISAAA